MANLVGRSFGSYQIIVELGRSSMGVVYKAQEPALNRFVALRVLPAYWADQPEFLAHFKREAETAAMLVHPHIIILYNIGEQAGLHYIAMQYVAGPNLKQVLEQRGRLPLSQAVSLIGQIASALDYAHARGCIHGEVKPANVLLRRGDSAVLSDFGLARALYNTGLAPPDVTVATAEYMAPEQAEGKPANGRSDIYSLGVLAFHMLTGALPFRAGSPGEKLTQHMTEPPPSLRQLNPELPPEVEPAVLRALAKKLEERYEQAGELARALAQASGLEETLLQFGVTLTPALGQTVLRPPAKEPGERDERTNEAAGASVQAPRPEEALPQPEEEPSPEVEPAVLPALTEKPEGRYEGAGEPAEAVAEAAGPDEALLQSEPASPSALSGPTGPPGSSWSAGCTLAMAGWALALLAGAGVFIWVLTRPPRAGTATLPTPAVPIVTIQAPAIIPAASWTPWPTATATASPSSTATGTPTDTPTVTDTPTETPSATPTRRPTRVPTRTPTNTVAPTETPLPTDTPVPTQKPPKPPKPTQPPPTPRP